MVVSALSLQAANTMAVMATRNNFFIVGLI
jgi:hypothetical protein